MNENKFEYPSERLIEFGDAAIIITDFNEFIRRFFAKLNENLPNKLCFLFDEIKYFSSKNTQSVIPMFSKIDYYSWQNEFRFSLGELNNKGAIIENETSLTLNIGNISDIAFQVATSDFISLNFDTNMIPDICEINDLFAQNINETRKIIKEYVPSQQKFIFSM